jgi:hypothetical protein
MPYCLINAFSEPRPRASAFQLFSSAFPFSAFHHFSVSAFLFSLSLFSFSAFQRFSFSLQLFSL